VLLFSHPGLTVTDLLTSMEVYSHQGSGFLMGCLPLTILQLWTKGFMTNLRVLGLRLDKEEESIIYGETQVSQKQIRDLNQLNLAISKSQRDWHFLKALSSAVSYCVQEVDPHRSGPGKAWLKLRGAALFQSKLVDSHEYDLSTLPRRIDNLFTAVSLLAGL
jgi:hypothetical protein